MFVITDDLHTGHRKRMLTRLSVSPETLSDHELLEILLYPVIRRKDTNGLAHKLLKVFGNLKNLFNADASEIASVDGAGEAVAAHIVSIGRIFAIVRQEKERDIKWFSFDNNRKEIVRLFYGLNDERFIIVLLNAKYGKITHLSFEDHDRFSVKAEIPEIAKAFALHKPKYAIVAHNHPSGDVNPSEADDFTTKKLNLLCDLHGVTLIDHVIVFGEKAFSYHVSGRMHYIKETADINKIMSTVMEE